MDGIQIAENSPFLFIILQISTEGAKSSLMISVAFSPPKLVNIKFPDLNM